MTSRLSCHHGHELAILELPASVGRVTCPRCGSITKVRPAHETRQSGSVDPTIDSVSKSEVEQHADFVAADAAADVSRFQTLDHSSSSVDQSSSEHDSREHFEPPTLAGYQVLDELGRGGMGVVYRARDEAIGREIALKTLQRMSPDGLHRFKQEFRTLADIAHPNLASLYELLSDGQTWCFTMEILEGVDFLEYVWSGFDGPDSIAGCQPTTDSGRTSRLTAERQDRLVNALTQLATGLNALHEAGVLHSDIKPSNVLMTKEGRLVLLDFGLAAQIRKHDAIGKRVVQGTPLYMAPEQAVGGALSLASDWYAVGVVLYEVLTGRFPFSGNTIQILSRKRSEAPMKPDRLASDAPQHFNELCIALLDRDPARRPTAADVLRCVGADALAEQVVAHQQATPIRSVELVGRERHFDVLRDALSRVSEGDTLSFFVHGKSGMGKSVLVRSFIDSVQQQRAAVVLEGRCYEQESVPFKALDSLIDSLSEYLETLPTGEIREVMPRDRLAMTRVFPVLDRAPERLNATYPSIDNVDQQELRQRAMNALRELLQRLAIREPLVLYIDDLQWGDVDSAGLLADLVRPPDAPRMLLLGSYRTEDVESSLCLQALSEAYSKGQYLPHREDLAVQSLTQTESTQLALTLLGREDDASRTFANKIAEESGGWPFFVWELAQHVQDDPEIADQSLELDEVIWARVTRLPMEARQLLELIAVSGRPIPTMEAYQAIDSVEKGQGYLAQLRTSNFVRTTESEDEDTIVETYHDRIRESVIAHLDKPTVQGHSLNLALTIEKNSGVKLELLRAHIDTTAEFEEPDKPHGLEKHQWQRVFDLAYSFDAAGEYERAFPFALAAAEQARSQNALEVAEQQYRIAIRGSKSAGGALQFRVSEGLGDILMLRGHYDAAEQQFRDALSRAKVDLALARIEGKLGELFSKRGDQTTATSHIERALTVLGKQPPRSSAMIALGLAKEGVTQILHSLLPAKLVGRRSLESEQSKIDLVIVRLYDRLSYAYWFSRGLYSTLWAHLRQLNLVECYPPTLELAQAYSLHAPIMSAVAYYSRGIDYAKRSLKIREEMHDLWGQGQSFHFHGVVLFASSQFEECIEKCREAIRRLENVGDFWEACSARYHFADSLYHLGDLRNAVVQAELMYQQAVEVGDASAAGYVLAPWAAATRGRISLDIIETEYERPREDPLSAVQLIQAHGIKVLLGNDDPAKAVELFEKARNDAATRGLQNTYVMANHAWLTTARRLLAEREENGSARQRQFLAQAKATGRQAVRVSRRFQNNLAHALRENAILAAMEGRETVARKLFDESLAIATQQHAKYQHAQTLLAQGETGLRFGWPNAEEQVAPSRKLIEGMEEIDGV
ncbi:MAG: protein kinase [Planctomycetes bacterium]|nr:protein kinase [Planctomycetota bacterium]